MPRQSFLATMDLKDSVIPNEVRDQAAYWFTRMHSGEIGDEEEVAFQAWHDADPLHARAYEHVSFVWDSSLAVSQNKLRAMLHAQKKSSKPILTRRNFGIATAGICAVLLVFVVGTIGLSHGAVQYTATLHTEHGKRQQFALPDGTILYANTETQATVTYYDKQRIVNLEGGEVYLDVAHDASRPFIVQAQLGEVMVTGTRFNVRNDVTSLDVAVVSGSVKVSTGGWTNTESQTLTKGMKVTINELKVLGEPSLVDAMTVAAWQRGRIIVENMPLAQVVKQLNRYLPMPVLLNAPHLNQYRVTGTFDADHPQSMINALPSIAPVSLYQLPDGRYRLVER